VTTGQTGSPLILRYEIHLHLPVSEYQLLPDQERLRGTVKVVAHPAVPPFVPVDMKPVKVPLTIPEPRTPLGFLRLQKIGVVTQKAKRKTIDNGRHVVLFGKTVRQKCRKIRTV